MKKMTTLLEQIKNKTPIDRLDFNQNLDAENMHGDTAIVHALYHPQAEELLARLLAYGANPHIRGLYPLHDISLLQEAIKERNFKFAEIILSRGIDPTMEIYNTGELLSECAEQDAVGIAKMLIDSGIDVNNITDKIPLLRVQSLDMLKLFIKNGVNLQQTDPIGECLLHKIVKIWVDSPRNKVSDANHPVSPSEEFEVESIYKVTHFLMKEKSIDINTLNNSEENVLSAIVTREEFLNTYPVKPAQLVKLMSAVDMLFELGVDINNVDKNGENALSKLLGDESSYPCPQLVQLLVEKGINTNQVDKNGDSILLNFSRNVSGFYSHNDVPKSLNKVSRDISLIDNDITTMSRKCEIIKYLINNGADVNLHNNGETVIGNLKGSLIELKKFSLSKSNDEYYINAVEHLENLVGFVEEEKFSRKISKIDIDNYGAMSI